MAASTRRLTLGALLLAALSACNAGGGSTPAPSKAPTGSSAATTPAPVSSAASQAPQQSAAGNLPTVKIGSVTSTRHESWPRSMPRCSRTPVIEVDRTGIGLGDRPVVAPAIESGQIDLQPEYIGSRIGYELKNPPGGASPAASPLPAVASPAQPATRPRT